MKPKLSPSRVFILVCFFAIASLAVFLLSLKTGIWGNSDKAIFCEMLSNGWIKQPSNTWSNLSFCFIGIIAAAQYSFRPLNTSNAFNLHPAYALLFLLSGVFLGPGSMALHATMTRLGGILDLFSMFLFSSFMFAYALKRLHHLRHRSFAIIYLTALITSCLVLIKPFPLFLNIGSVDFTFGLFAIGGSLIELYLLFIKKRSISTFWGLSYMACFIVAFIIWQFDFSHCEPDGIFQFHALWHLLCSFSVYLIFRYYWSENHPLELVKK